MSTSLDTLVSPVPIRFDLKSMLVAIAAVGVFIAPTQWFGGAYLVSAAMSVGLVGVCAYVYRYTHPAAAFGLALAFAFVSFPFAILFLVVCLHAMANVLLCLVFVAIPNRPRLFGATAACLAVVIYGLCIRGGLAKRAELSKLRAKYPLISLADRLDFESSQSSIQDAFHSPQLSPDVNARLDEQDVLQRQHYWDRAWGLEELHERSYAHFARAAGFGFMRMPSLRETVLELEPQRPIMVPMSVGKLSASAPTAELQGVHDAAFDNFVDPDRIGYARSRDEVAGFEPHELSSNAFRNDCRSIKHPQWNVIRLELVSLLRNDEPRVYVAASMPAMDELESVPTRSLNHFERNALPKLVSQADTVVDRRSDRIQMLGAVRAGKSCLTCHDGPRGKLLGAFSYEIAPRVDAFQAGQGSAATQENGT